MKAVVQSDGPDWIRGAVVTVRDEIVRFGESAWRISIQPRRFAAAWFAGATGAGERVSRSATAGRCWMAGRAPCSTGDPRSRTQLIAPDIR
jgi:hypothetical protein